MRGVRDQTELLGILNILNRLRLSLLLVDAVDTDFVLYQGCKETSGRKDRSEIKRIYDGNADWVPNLQERVPDSRKDIESLRPARPPARHRRNSGVPFPGSDL